MKYMNSKQAEAKWKISERRIRKLLQEDRIEGATKIGKSWYIPEDAQKPIDKRQKVDSEDNYIILIDNKLLEEVDRLKSELDSKRPLPKATLKSLEESNLLDWTYNSNAIEGNTLTLRETKVVLEGITIGGKSINEHLEAINHKEAILYLEELVKKDVQLKEYDIKSIHNIILKGIDSENAGKYRNENVFISGATNRPCDYLLVPEEMEKLICRYEKWDKYHPLIRAALIHSEFVFIHPFIDGNGRTARLLMNFEAMKNGYLPIIIKKEFRNEYYDALDEAQTTKNYTRFVKMIIELEIEMLRKYLDVI